MSQPLKSNVSHPAEMLDHALSLTDDPELNEMLLSDEHQWVPITRSSAPFFFEDAKAKRASQGRTDLTMREARRLKHFTSSADAWPLPYRWMPYLEYEAELSGYLAGLALRVMRLDSITPTSKTTRGTLRKTAPSVRMVAASVLDLAFKAGRAYITYDDVRPTLGSIRLPDGERTALFSGQINYWLLQRKCREAAEFAWEHWSDEYMSDLSHWGATGGRKSRRGASYTLDGLEGLSIREQAQRLGCTERTVSNLRKALKSKPILG